MEHREEVSNLARVQKQVDEVKGIMLQNIDKTLNRGIGLEVLVDKTDNLRSQASEFTPSSVQLSVFMPAFWYGSKMVANFALSRATLSSSWEDIN
ncbi:vesicle-associated membrane protein 721-like protein [Carex littledalei]|uniref:Vesicle-associated membrane protein 721-like protein n=1 Tax=Carex littledalei TaxID=544730 RepID=A0A833RIB6_9POAL|nr:vesicle-associated membrane protein 721-like protein [Carex littledalei]